MDLGVILDTVKIIWSVTSKCVKYHRGLNENMKNLNEKLEELNGRKTDIESQTIPELHTKKILKKEVVIWLQRVQEFNNDKHLVQEFGKVKFLSRAYLGRLVAKKILEVEQHHQKGSFSDGLMVDAAPGREEMLSTTTLVGETTSEKVEEIWRSLIRNDIQRIGVYGMGGSGKSTIMKHIHNRVLEESNKFDHVYWITVSKATSVIKLQGGIASALDFKGIEKIEDEGIRASMLVRKLKEKKRCVLIFDDVWEAFDLEHVGIPEPTVGNGCKMMLTTRSLGVCRQMDSTCIKMGLLSKDEAWTLFLDKVGCDISMAPDVKAIAKQVAKECACLPLAIITIGTSMKGVVDKRGWRNALRMLRDSTKGLDKMGKVIEQLKYSYTRLQEENAKCCLLYCALYPEDFIIERHELIAFLFAEEIIGAGSRQEGFDEGHAILNDLENACLLENCTGIDTASIDTGRQYVKMHDVIRDMALQIMGRKSLVEAGLHLTEFPEDEKWKEDLERVSLMKNYIEEIPPDASPRCSMLKTLLLLNCRKLARIPDSFFSHMPSLCVLDLSKTAIEKLPNSISDLENLTALMLRECYNLYYVPSLAKLRRLRELDLNGAKIEEVPQGMEMLVNLRYLNLYTKHLKTFPTGVLTKFIRLQCLILYCGSETLKIKGKELTGLKKLERLVCQLYDLTDSNSYFRSLQRHHRRLPYSEVRLPNSYNVHVGRDILAKLTYFELKGKHCKVVGVNMCNTQRNGEAEAEDRDDPFVVVPNDVEDFRIANCNEVSSLLDVQVQSLFNLEVLQLVGLNNLRAASTNSPLLIHCTFSRLKKLHIVRCPNVKQLFTPGLVPHLQNLEEINVWSCEGMEEIVAVEEEDVGMGDSLIISITLPKLSSLSLCDLPELKSIMCRMGIMVCDSITRIEIDGCPKLKRLPLYMPLSNGQPSPPPSLTDLMIDTEEWWDSLEWDNPINKDVLQPFLKVS